MLFICQVGQYSGNVAKNSQEQFKSFPIHYLPLTIYVLLSPFAAYFAMRHFSIDNTEFAGYYVSEEVL